MKNLLLAIFLTAISLHLWCAETVASAKKEQLTPPVIHYSSESRLKPEAYMDEAKARKLLRMRDAKINEMIAERQRIFLENADIKELWNEISAKYRRVASYLKTIGTTGDPETALANHPDMLAVYRDARKSLSQLAMKIDTRKTMLTLSSQLADIDFEIDQLKRNPSFKNINPSTSGSK